MFIGNSMVNAVKDIGGISVHEKDDGKETVILTEAEKERATRKKGEFTLFHIL